MFLFNFRDLLSTPRKYFDNSERFIQAVFNCQNPHLEGTPCYNVVLVRNVHKMSSGGSRCWKYRVCTTLAQR